MSWGPIQVMVTVKLDVLLITTLQTSTVTLVLDWQFESSKLELSTLNLLEQIAKFRFSFSRIKQSNTSSVGIKEHPVQFPWIISLHLNTQTIQKMAKVASSIEYFKRVTAFPVFFEMENTSPPFTLKGHWWYPLTMQDIQISIDIVSSVVIFATTFPKCLARFLLLHNYNYWLSITINKTQ